MDKIVVVMPAYNAGFTIEETLHSVLVQTYVNFEVVVVDDCSSDNTLQVVRRIADNDSRVSIIPCIENIGTAAARNKGIKKSSSNFIAVIDADDIWHPRKLEIQYAKFQNSSDEVGMVCSPCRLLDEASNVIPSPPNKSIEGRCMWQLLYHNPARNGSSYMFKREVFDRVGGFDLSLMKKGVQGCEDIFFAIQVAEIAHIACTDEILVGYRQLSESQSSNKRNMFNSRVEMLRELARLYPEIPEVIFSWSVTHPKVRMIGHEFIQNKNIVQFFKALSESLKSDFVGTCAALNWGFKRYIDFMVVNFRSRARPFYEYDITEGSSKYPPVYARRLRKIAEMEGRWAKSNDYLESGIGDKRH